MSLGMPVVPPETSSSAGDPGSAGGAGEPVPAWAHSCAHDTNGPGSPSTMTWRRVG
ncbi:Uncharacterised protein [Mycobacterium tuberculosis]|nr:Uncharacterised protein [Mycobacterium tuberculosis]